MQAAVSGDTFGVSDPAVLAALERDGYVVVPFLTEGELASVRQLQAALPVDHTSPAFAWTALRTPDDEGDDEGGDEGDNSGDRQARLPLPLRAAAARQFSGHRIIDAVFLTKLPGGAHYALHQHPPLTDEPFGRTYICWSPLTDVDAAAGTLLIVPGSHRTYNFVRLSNEGEFFAGYRDELTGQDAVPVAVRAGEAVIFDNSLIHGSCANGGAAARTAMIAAILPAAARHCVYRREEDGGIAVIYDGDDAYKMVIEPGADVPPPTGAVIRRLPAWNRKARLDQLRALIASGTASGRRADEACDPLVTAFGTDDPPPAPSAPHVDQQPSPTALRRMLAPFVPAPLKALRRRIIAARR